MRRSKRTASKQKEKNTVTKKKIRTSLSDLSEEEQQHDSKETSQQSDSKSDTKEFQNEQIENVETFIKAESVECNDVIAQSGCRDSAGGRSGDGIIVQKPESEQGYKTMPDFLFQDEDGDTYLHIAVVQCNVGLVNFLIQAMKTTKLDIFNNLRQTPLHLAVITGQRHLVGLLIKAGCDVNAMDRNGQTPLHLACQRSDIDSAQIIFESITADHREIKLDIKNFDGFSPLHLAAVTGNRDLIGLVIDKGADINIKDTSSGRTALHHAVEAGRFHVVEYFLSRGASANVTTYSGNTPLHTAAGRHMQEMIRLLSEHGADVNMANMEGDKPRVVQGSEQGKRQLEASRKRTKKPKTSTSTGQTSTWKTRKT